MIGVPMPGRLATPGWSPACDSRGR
jgi:hypothetical protein